MPEFDIHRSQVEADSDFDRALRPLAFSDFRGQTQVVKNLSIFVHAAKQRGESLDYVLLYGLSVLG